MNAGRRGSARERQVADYMRAEFGMVVYRSAGSHGNADLIGLKVGLAPWLVQVKTCAGGPFDHFRPAERLALEHEALAAGAVPYLCHWPAHGAMTWYGRFQWPRTDAIVAAVDRPPEWVEIDERLRSGSA